MAAAADTKGVRVLLAGAEARGRLHLRRILAGTIGIEIVGHVRPGTAIEESMRRCSLDVVLIDPSENTAAAEDEIALRVRPITLEQAMANADKLRELYTRYSSGDGTALPSRCFAGLKFIDFFTFKQRLSVRGKMNMNFFDFFE